MSFINYRSVCNLKFQHSFLDKIILSTSPITIQFCRWCLLIWFPFVHVITKFFYRNNFILWWKGENFDFCFLLSGYNNHILKNSRYLNHLGYFLDLPNQHFYQVPSLHKLYFTHSLTLRFFSTNTQWFLFNFLYVSISHFWWNASTSKNLY